jgi:hypothetical protein
MWETGIQQWAESGKPREQSSHIIYATYFRGLCVCVTEKAVTGRRSEVLTVRAAETRVAVISDKYFGTIQSGTASAGFGKTFGWSPNACFYKSIWHCVTTEITGVLMRLCRSWLGHCATNRKVAGSIPDGVTEIFQWLNHAGRTVALGSTQPLIGMNTRNPSWG